MAEELDYQAVFDAADPWAGIPERYNLGVALTAGNVPRLGDRVALFWENTDGDRAQYTYAQLDRLTNQLAGSLVELGVRRGDRVFLRLPNVPAFYISALAVAKLGGVFIPSSTMFRAKEIVYRVNDSGAAAVITTTGLVDEVRTAASSCPDLEHVITLAYGGAPTPSDLLDFDRLIEDGPADFEPADTANDDIAFIAYPSGTTGDPKGVVHMHRYPLAYEGLITWWHDYRPDDVVACPPEVGWMLPVASTFLYAMRHGLSIVLYHETSGGFQPGNWFDLIERYRITNFVGTPTIYRMMLKAQHEAADRDLSAWRHGVSAGEPLPPDTYVQFFETFGKTILDGIGMSECMVYCHNFVSLVIRMGSCGRPSPGVDIRVMDESMNEVQPGETGVLCVRRDTHPGMMKQYWNKPEQDAEVFRGPWYYSGDVVEVDEYGYYWFKGRADDVIKASGYRISPFEVESCLMTHPAVLEAAVVSSPDELRGSVVKAFVVLRDGHVPSDALADELQNHVKSEAAPYKYPRRVEFTDALPKTASGKIKRALLRQQEMGQNTPPA
jgi:acyl-coenzyme A synthetase/AMP-(fatty) acid ligase